MSDHSDHDGEDHVEELTSAAQVAQRFQEWWISERNCPNVLPYQGDLVDCLLDQLNHMRAGLSQLKANDLRAGLHRLEVERIQYTINDYLRCRLNKIHKMLPHRLSDEITDLLSTQEKTFVEDTHQATDSYFHTAGLSHMPEGIQNLSLPPIKPQGDNYVFCRVKKPALGILVDSEEVDFDFGSQHIVQLDIIKNYVHNSSFILM